MRTGLEREGRVDVVVSLSLFGFRNVRLGKMLGFCVGKTGVREVIWGGRLEREGCSCG
jgi:hypothetical protein